MSEIIDTSEADDAFVGWREVPIEDVTPQDIDPGAIVSDVPSVTRFNDVETMVVSRLSPYVIGTSPEHALGAKGNMRVARNRIANILRPKGFDGTLLGGYVAITELDRDVAISQATSNLQRERLADSAETPFGFGVAYMGVLRSSRGGIINGFKIDTTYYRRKYPHINAREMDNNSLFRTIGELSAIQEAEGITAERKVDSQVNAYKLTRQGLRHIISVGLPTLGKGRK